MVNYANSFSLVITGSCLWRKGTHWIFPNISELGYIQGWCLAKFMCISFCKFFILTRANWQYDCCVVLYIFPLIQGGTSTGYKKFISEKGIEDDTYSESGVALFRVQGSGPENMQAIQVDTVLFFVNLFQTRHYGCVMAMLP